MSQDTWAKKKKKCKTCGQDKSAEDFHKSKYHSDHRKTQCKSCVKDYASTYYIKNKDKLSLNHKEKYSENSQKFLVRQSKWAKRNKHLINAKSAKRRAKKSSATPKWLSKKHLEEIKNIYKVCQKITKRSGKKHHVDHIVPLKGKTVCGLHVPWNLSIIPAKMNLEKGNIFNG